MRVPSRIGLAAGAVAVSASALLSVSAAAPAVAQPRGPTDSQEAETATASSDPAPRARGRRTAPRDGVRPSAAERTDASPAGLTSPTPPAPPPRISSTIRAARPAQTEPAPFDEPIIAPPPVQAPILPTAVMPTPPTPPQPPFPGALIAPAAPPNGAAVQSLPAQTSQLHASPAKAPARSLDVLLGVLPPPGPTQPPESPLSWTTLAVARRQLGQPRSIPIPAATVSSGQLVAPSAAVPAAATAVNQPPMIAGVTLNAPNPSTGAVTGTVKASDPNSDRITYRAKTSTKGKVSITTAGVFTYTPTNTARHAAAKIGAPISARTDTVTVTATDSKGAANSLAVPVPILPKNRAPVATVSVGKPNASTGVVKGAVRATDPDGDTRSFTGTATTAKGSITVNSSTGAFTYTPTAVARHTAAGLNATAADKTANFTVTVTDGYGGAATVPVTVAISPRNTAPVASGAVGRPDAVSGIARGKVTASDSDLDALSYSATAPVRGTVAVSTDGSFAYTPTATARTEARKSSTTLSDPFTITVKDGYGGTVAVTVRPTIAPSNAAPVPGTPTMSVDPVTGSVTGTVNATDPDKDSLTYTAANTTTAKGAVSVSSTGAFSYTPTATARQNATSSNATTADKADTFTVSVTDKHGAASAVAVNVPVTPVGNPPPPRPERMAVGMNLENVVDWSPAWTFTDAFKASRPWISHSFNPQTWSTTWDPAQAPPLDVDANGNIRSLKTWTQNNVQMKQHAGTLMFDGIDGGYAGGTYHAEWDGTGVVTFGNDALATATGKTAAGRNFAKLQVTPSDNGIYLRIEETDPADPVRDFNVWMPDYNGQSFVGQRWQPGARFSPFHPLFLSRLDSFDALRFMGMQETNTSDIVTWADRRDTADIRQGSGPEGTPSQPIVNGMSLEYMVELANELDADPWFNMPYQADDTFVRNFARYVSQHLEPGRTVYVEWANEVWNFGYGFEASHWVAQKADAAGLDPDYGQWIVAGREAKRDLAIWSDVFANQSALRLVRVAAGWAAVDWVTNQIAENMDGAFDAIAIAPYITPTDEQRAGYTASTSVDRVIADTRTNMATSLQWTANHERLAQDWSTRLGRPIELLAYEGGPHLDGRNAAYQNAFYAATNDPRMADIYRDYLKRLDSAGMDLYVDFQFTGPPGAAPWGDFAKLHRMNESLATAYRYNAVVSAADGTLWSAL